MRTILLTGGTGGIGREAARRLATPATTLVLAVRAPARGAGVAAELRRATPGVHVEVEECDLARLADVRALAARVAARHRSLDALVHDAAVVTPTRETTIDGHERQLQVNHLAPYLLTRLLLPLLHAAPAARVVTVASKVHYDATLALDDLQLARGPWDRARAYDRSKLANVLFTRELARRLGPGPVTANCLHPGVYATTLLSALFDVPWYRRPLWHRRFPDAAAGGRALARLVEDPALAGVTGAYFDVDRLAEPSAAARDPMLARALWEASARLVGLPD